MGTEQEDGRIIAIMSALTILMGREIAHDSTAREAMSRQFDASNFAVGATAGQRELDERITEARIAFQSLLNAAQAIADTLTDPRTKGWRRWLDRMTRPN